jgi:[DsrC]-trisulfide reductase subunit O
MVLDRREFIRIAGLTTALGLTGKAGWEAFAEGELPQESPLEGERWAMVIDIKKCLEQGECDDCIAACHVAHNVPAIENEKHEVKWIWKEPFEEAFPGQKSDYLQEGLKHAPVLLLCNHCENPPCTKVCPTQATWKREKDGIVMMDWHRCIGCRYCMAACPYGSRSFNWIDPRESIETVDPVYPTRCKGVVEKCTFCDDRLSRGQLPSCVEACKSKALAFGDLGNEESEVRELLRSRYAIRRKVALGTNPEVYYLV